MWTNARKTVVAILAAASVLGCSSEESGESASTTPVARVTSALGPGITEFAPQGRWQGRIQAIDIDQADKQFAIAAADSGGLFRTTDGGATWVHLDGARIDQTRDVAICPTNRNIVVATALRRTGVTLADDTGGIYTSADAGTTWTRNPIANVAQTPFTAWGVAFQPGTNCQTVYVGTDFGLARSTNAGAAWTQMNVGGVQEQVIAVLVQTDGTIDIHNFWGHRRFNPATSTWSPRRPRVGPVAGLDPNGVPSSPDCHSLAISPLNQNVLFASSWQSTVNIDTDSNGTLDTSVVTGPWEGWESDDGGVTWHSMVIRPPQYGNGRPPFPATVRSRTTSPTQIDFYFGDSIHVIRQTCNEAGGTGPRCTIGNGTATDPAWEFIDLDPRSDGSNCFATPGAPCAHQDPSDMAFDPTNNCPLYLAGDGGVLKADPSYPGIPPGSWQAVCGQTNSWRSVGAGTLNALLVHDFGGQTHPGAGIGTDLFFATFDTGHWASMDTGVTWPGLLLWEGMNIEVPHSEPTRANTKITLTNCASCGNRLATAGYASDVPWNNPTARSCPDEDLNNVCDTCVDAINNMTGMPGADLVCDPGTAGGVLCRDAAGNPLLVPAPPAPLPQCSGITCVDAVGNGGDPKTDGFCDPVTPNVGNNINLGINLTGLAPIVLSPARYVQWDGGARRYSDGNLLLPNQLRYSADTGTTWNAVPTAFFGALGDNINFTEVPAGNGAASVDAGGNSVFYQGTQRQTMAGVVTYGLVRIANVGLATAAMTRADVGLTSINTHVLGFRTPHLAFGVDPANDQRLLAADQAGMRRSTTGGTAWSTVGVDTSMNQLTTLITAGSRLMYGNGNSNQVSAIQFDPSNAQRIFVGTEQSGAIASLDGGNSWDRLCQSRKVPFISAFFNDEDQGVDYMSSYGRGLWKIDPTQKQVPTFVTPPANVTVNDCRVDIGQATASDTCDNTPVKVVPEPNATPGSPAYGCQNPAIRPCGNFPMNSTTTITWVATDSAGAQATATSTVTVGADTTGPVFSTIPPDLTTTVCSNTNIGQAFAADSCGGTVTITNNKPAKFPLGVNTVTWTAVDQRGNARTATQRVTVLLGDDASCCPAGTTVIQGTSNNDNLIGTANSDCILGKGSQDTITGNGGNDFISGGDGNDNITGGLGNDMIFAGSGQDTVNGNDGNDTLFGGDGDDNVQGGIGDDVLRGGQGQDTLLGQDGNDFLFGEHGDDNLQGGNGNDQLAGGPNTAGNDTCTDSVGTNTFAQCELGGGPNSCADGSKDGTETDLDCGGGCDRCPITRTCTVGSDCTSGVCAAGVCQLLTGGIAVIPVFDTDWGGGYCVHLEVTNVEDVATVTWTAALNTNQSSIYTSWGASFSGSSGAITVTPNVDASRIIDPNETDISIGFCANRNVSGSGVVPFVTSGTASY